MIKRLVSAALFGLTFMLGGCAPAGPSESDKALCESIRANLSVALADAVYFRQYEYTDPSSFAWIKGQDVRDEFLSNVKELHPWLMDIPLDNPYQSDFIRAKLWEIATEGTAVQYTMTSAEQKRYISEEDYSVDEFIDKPHMDVLAAEEIENGCYAVDQQRIAEAGDTNLVETYGAFLKVEDLLEDTAEQLEVVRTCAVSGQYLGSSCVKDSLVSSNTAKTNACEKKLQITENTAQYGDCGTLTFKVFQADLNTGDYRALAWWTDANGNEKLGMFMIGGLTEGATYTMSVSVGRETTYTTELGSENTVTTFLKK